MVVEAKIDAPAFSHDVAGGAVVHGYVMDKTGAIIETGEEVVVAFEIDPMMAGAVQYGIWLAFRFVGNVLDGAKIAAGEDAAIGVGYDEIARPTIRDFPEGDGIEALLGEMSAIGRVRKFKAQVFHTGFSDGGGETEDPRMPLQADVKPQRAVKGDLVAIDAGDTADQ